MSHSLLKKDDGGFSYRVSEKMLASKGVRHLFTTRLGGESRAEHLSSLNLRFDCGDTRETVLKNYEIALSHIGVPIEKTVCTKQAHGANVRVVSEKDAGLGLFFRDGDEGYDGLVTKDRGIALIGYYADCCVGLFSDERAGVIAVAHAGWRGCAGGIFMKTVDEMISLGARAGDILCAMSPSIGKCCFETDRDVPDAMISRFSEEKMRPFIEKRGEKWHVNIAKINEYQLLSRGIDPENIAISDECTAEDPRLFWSHRKVGNMRGVHGAMIALL